MLQALGCFVDRQQALQEVGFFLGAFDAVGFETLAQFIFAQQREQGVEVQMGLAVDPACFQQRRGGQSDIADFCVIQLAGAKQRAFAHDHAHQQRLCRLRQQGKIVDETPLVFIEQVVVALGDPVQHLAEVFQVVKRIVEGRKAHGEVT